MAEAIAAAEGSATTDWTTFDGPVPSKFMFHAIFFPIVMGAFLIVPGIICWFALGFGHRGRIAPYSPQHPARFVIGNKDIQNGSVHNGHVAEV